MALKRMATNGTVLADGQVLIEAAKITWKSANGLKIMQNLSGQGGAAYGRPKVEGTIEFTVPELDAERRALIRKYQNQQGITLSYRTGGTAMRADVGLGEMEASSTTDEPDTFSMSFAGIEEPVQG